MDNAGNGGPSSSSVSTPYVFFVDQTLAIGDNDTAPGTGGGDSSGGSGGVNALVIGIVVGECLADGASARRGCSALLGR